MHTSPILRRLPIAGVSRLTQSRPDWPKARRDEPALAAAPCIDYVMPIGNRLVRCVYNTIRRWRYANSRADRIVHPGRMRDCSA